VIVEGEELKAIARGFIVPNRFITIGTADEEDVPRGLTALVRLGGIRGILLGVRSGRETPDQHRRLVALEYPPANAANR
jgi:hypothetical protein